MAKYAVDYSRFEKIDVSDDEEPPRVRPQAPPRRRRRGVHLSSRDGSLPPYNFKDLNYYCTALAGHEPTADKYFSVLHIFIST